MMGGPCFACEVFGVILIGGVVLCAGPIWARVL